MIQQPSTGLVAIIREIRGEIALGKEIWQGSTVAHIPHRLIEPVLAALEKAIEFKAYVHDRLDKAGVPADPEAAHTKETGCRIEGRLNWLIGQSGSSGFGLALSDVLCLAQGEPCEKEVTRAANLVMAIHRFFNATTGEVRGEQISRLVAAAVETVPL